MKDKEHNDASSIAVWNATPQYLDRLDMIRGRWQFPELVRRVKAFYQKYEPFGCASVYIEDKASGTPLGQLFAEQGIPTVLWKPQDYAFPLDKVGRAKMSIWYIEGGRVRLPGDGTPWVQPFIDECAAFTGEKTDTDDQVDDLTMGVSVWKYKGGGDGVNAQ
jgi:predicted phage terminase large subunit-like protein